MQVKFLSKERIEDIAEELLAKYNPDNIFPLDIERIVEFELGLDIVPVNNLKRESDHVAYLSKDLKTIFVDQYIYVNVEARYRFTLAHEVGHIFLHRQIFENLDYKSTEEFLEAMLANTKAYGWMEFQANLFAACCLMPLDLVEKDIIDIMPEIKGLISIASKSDLARSQYLESAITFVASQICDLYGVSEGAMTYRISSTALQDLIP